MYNNASYQRYTVSGGPTDLQLYRRRRHRARAAGDHGLDRRDGEPVEPDPGIDGSGSWAYKVTNPSRWRLAL